MGKKQTQKNRNYVCDARVFFIFMAFYLCCTTWRRLKRRYGQFLASHATLQSMPPLHMTHGMG